MDTWSGVKSGLLDGLGDAGDVAGTVLGGVKSKLLDALGVAGDVAGNVLGVAGDVLDSPRRLIYQGISGLTGKNWKGFGDVLSEVGVDKNSIPGMVGGFLGDVASDPLTWAGVGMGRYLRGLKPTMELGAAAGATGATPTMRQALKGTAVLDDIAPLDSGVGMGVKARRGLPAGDADALAERARGVLPEFESGRVRGMFDPETNVIATARGAAPAVSRHERTHAIISNASQDPALAAQLPTLLRTPAQLLAAPKGTLRHGAGMIGDELAAHALQSRNYDEQVRNALGFLFNPRTNAYYANDFQGSMHPWIRKGYSALPTAPDYAGAGGSSLLHALQGNTGHRR